MKAAAIATIFVLTAAPAPVQIRQGVDAATQSVPILANSPSGQLLRYELRLTNFSKSPLTLARLQIIDTRSGRELGILSGEALSDALRPIRADRPNGPTVLQPGRVNLLFIDLRVPRSATPADLRHQLTLSDGSSEFVVESPATPVRPAPPSDLGPPLKGGPWVAVYEPSMDGGHRRVPYATSGRATIPGRFAIDWFRVDDKGRQIPSTGAPVLAVADGIVVDMRDDFPDPAPNSTPLGPDLANDAGNYVALRIADGRFVFYEHLQHRLRVKTGDRVHRGRLLAFVGSTGHVTGPHLHFHVADANSPLGAEGIPYGFRNFELIGRFRSISDFDKGAAWEPASGSRTGLPDPNSIVRFPD
jgi:murein DD-endopeptidase